MSRRLVDGSERGTREEILEAARASLLDFGVRGTSIAGVARRARVGRMTVYRHFPESGELMRELMTREFGALYERIAQRHAEGDARWRIVGALTDAVTEMRGNRLFRRIVAAEPELLVPYLVERVGASQKAALALVERGVRDGQADGSVREGDVEAIAFATYLIAQSFTLSAGTGGRLSARRINEQLPVVLDGALAPHTAENHNTRGTIGS